MSGVGLSQDLGSFAQFLGDQDQHAHFNILPLTADRIAAVPADPHCGPPLTGRPLHTRSVRTAIR